ncbi:MAG: GntR family transcriptional regulator [Rhodobacterales bacterium]
MKNQSPQSPVEKLAAEPSPLARRVFDEVDSATLSDEIYSALREGLMIGEWLPGAKITARSVAKHCNTSLTPARDAMTRLANEGGLLLSETRMYSVPSLTAEDYNEVMKIRLVLEPMAAEQATPFLSDEDIAELERTNESMRGFIENDQLQAGLIMDSRLHLNLYRSCGSNVLWQVINNLWLRIGPTRNMLSKSYRKGLSGYENHKLILNALKDRDAGLSGRLIRRDLKQGAKKLETALREQSEILL